MRSKGTLERIWRTYPIGKSKERSSKTTSRRQRSCGRSKNQLIEKAKRRRAIPDVVSTLKAMNRQIVGICRALLILLPILFTIVFVIQKLQDTASELMQKAKMDFYVDQTYDFIGGNNRHIVSIRDGKIDFMVFMKARERGYPNYSASMIGENRAVGFIMRTSFKDRVNITGSSKAYELTKDGVKSTSIDIEISPLELPELLGKFEGDYTIRKLEEIKDEL